MSTYTLRTIDSNGRQRGPTRRVTIEPPPSETPPPAPADTAGYPADGTVADILDWVGDQPDRAKAAIVAEHGKDTPRKTLLTKLNERIGG